MVEPKNENCGSWEKPAQPQMRDPSFTIKILVELGSRIYAASPMTSRPLWAISTNYMMYFKAFYEAKLDKKVLLLLYLPKINFHLKYSLPVKYYKDLKGKALRVRHGSWPVKLWASLDLESRNSVDLKTEQTVGGWENDPNCGSRYEGRSEIRRPWALKHDIFLERERWWSRNELYEVFWTNNDYLYLGMVHS